MPTDPPPAAASQLAREITDALCSTNGVAVWGAHPASGESEQVRDAMAAIIHAKLAPVREALQRRANGPRISMRGFQNAQDASKAMATFTRSAKRRWHPSAPSPRRPPCLRRLTTSRGGSRTHLPSIRPTCATLQCGATDYAKRRCL
jgi:hypothetical protein